MMKRSRGRPPKVSPFNQDPEFFEVFLPDRISHQLRIPADFIKHFKQKIPEAVILRDLSGKVWHIDLKQDENGFFLKNGWNRFVNEKSLRLGEFMVFRYHKRSAAFTVRIFGLDACKKDEAQDFDKPFNFVKEQESDQEPSPICKHKHQNIASKKPETFVGNKAKKVKRHGRFDAKDNNFNAKTPSAQPILLKTPRNGSKRVKQHKGFEAEKILFATSICPSKQFQLHIPRRILKMYNAIVRPNEAVLLYNEKEESWPVTILNTADDRTIISKGWSQFRKDNGVKLGDRIECRLVLSTRRVLKQLHVKIIRVYGRPKTNARFN